MVSGGEVEKFLMRFLLCKIHCPCFICFCKPSSPHIYTSGPLKLENTPNVPPNLVSVPQDSDQNKLIREEILDGNQQLAENCLKSNLRKPNSDSDSAAPTEKQKKTVQWMDLLGKQLVEIREFESRYLLFQINSTVDGVA